MAQKILLKRSAVALKVPTSSSLDLAELGSNTTERKLIKIIDLLGRTTIATNNNPLFYIYDNGSVEKKIIIE